MLDLDRDEDAYNFIKWWLTIDPDSHWDNVPKSQPGEWLYLRDQVCGFLKIKVIIKKYNSIIKLSYININKK